MDRDGMVYDRQSMAGSSRPQANGSWPRAQGAHGARRASTGQVATPHSGASFGCGLRRPLPSLACHAVGWVRVDHVRCTLSGEPLVRAVRADPHPAHGFPVVRGRDATPGPSRCAGPVSPTRAHQGADTPQGSRRHPGFTSGYTPAIVGAMPNQPRTPGRNIRVPDDVWIPARTLAESRDETITSVVTNALRRYIKRHAA